MTDIFVALKIKFANNVITVQSTSTMSISKISTISHYHIVNRLNLSDNRNFFYPL
jgi:hypothetical protein